MITAWMLYSLVVGALVTVGAHLVDRAARAARIPRRWTWVGALALLFALTALAPWRAFNQRDKGARPALQPDESAFPSSQETGAPSLRDRIAGWVTLPLQKRIDRMAAFVPASIDRALATAWTLATLSALSLVWLSLHRIDRQRRRWPKSTLHGREVRVAANHGPAVYGVFEPDIVVPATLLACPADDQRMVLAHEDEHRLAKDPLLLTLSAVGVALFPWHPASWWLSSRARLAIELDCDARVISRGTSPRSYGEFLVRHAGGITARQRILPTLALLHPRTHLEGRLLAMTTRPVIRTPARLAAVLLTGAAVVAVACTAEVPTAAQVRDADATTVVQELRLPSAEVVYVIDGTRVSPEEAKRLDASAIATIEVHRGSSNAASGASEIRIATVEGAKRALDRRGRLEETLAAARQGEGVTPLRQDGDSGARRVDEVVVRQRVEALSAAVRQDPLFIIDGVVKTPLKGLYADQIESVEVLKGDAAIRLYGEAGRHGVVKVTTKKP